MPCPALVPWQKLFGAKPLNLARYVDALPIPPAIPCCPSPVVGL